ncbi:hypothetical protein B2I21_04775 [Chryseobacterium mucoviscidosis]|nr:hypothetical protein B2I21_04775 [Chryseobacterium mucoviscidosis]
MVYISGLNLILLSFGALVLFIGISYLILKRMPSTKWILLFVMILYIAINFWYYLRGSANLITLLSTIALGCTLTFQTFNKARKV